MRFFFTLEYHRIDVFQQLTRWMSPVTLAWASPVLNQLWPAGRRCCIFFISLCRWLTAHLLSRKSMCQVMIYKSQRVDCEQYLFSSKIPGEERKTSKRTTVTVSVTCEQRYRLFCILPTDFRGKRDCQTLETAHSLVRTVVKYAHDKFLKFRRGSRLECWNFSS